MLTDLLFEPIEKHKRILSRLIDCVSYLGQMHDNKIMLFGLIFLNIATISKLKISTYSRIRPCLNLYQAE